MKKDLIILAADSTARTMLDQLIDRFPIVLGLRPFSCEILVHPKRDPGCYNFGVDDLTEYEKHFEHCILMFDHEGCGAEHNSAAEIETELERQLITRGWNNRNAVIVIDPELENWIWTNSLHTAKAMGWEDLATLTAWLTAQKWLQPNAKKPNHPKEAMEAAVKYRLRKPITKEMFESIAAKASFKSCTSPSFIKFKNTVVRWFTPENQ
jgi:hypothetical protein